MMFLDHTLGIFTHPDKEWLEIRSQHHSKLKEFITHIPVLALIPAFAFYYGTTQVGWGVAGDAKIGLTEASALSLVVISYFGSLVGVWVFAEFVNWMSHTFSDEEVDPHHGMALAVYVATPIFLAGIAGVYPEVWFNALMICLAGTYSVYLIYEGMPILMNIPEERAFIYSTSVLTVVLVGIVSLRVVSVLIWSLGFSPEYVTLHN